MSSSAENIYNAVGRFYGWQQMPKTSTGVFFGFPGMTRAVMIDAIEALQMYSSYLTFNNDEQSNKNFWFNEAYNELKREGKTGGAAKEAFTKWFNWLYVAAAGDSDIKDFFGGKPYTTADYIGSIIADKLADVSETVEYGLEQPAAIPDLLIPTKSNFVKWVIIGGVLLFAAKKFKLI